MKNIAQLSQDLINSLREGRTAILGRGGDIAPDAGFRDFRNATYSIPADNTITTITDESVATAKTVPTNSTQYAYLAEFGGMTYRDAETDTLRNTKLTEIVSKGVNLYSGSEEFVLDGTQKNITIPIVGAEEITTFSFVRDGTRVNAATLFQLVYEDGTVFGIAPGVSSGVETIKYTAKSKVTAIKLVNWCQFTGRVYDIQLENGPVATKRKPYIGTISTRAIPEEIRALEGLDDGISLEYYNKVDLVNNKYKRCIETRVFDGSEGTGSSSRPTGWRMSGSGNATYFLIKIGEFGEYAIGDTIICDKYDTATVGGTNIGVWTYDSSASGGVCVGFRPENVSEITSTSALVAHLANNPITVKVARTIPIETDLPVKMTPLIAVEGGGSVVIKSDNGYAVPSKIIYQTFN